MKSTDIKIRELTADTEHFAYRSPMKFGGRVVTDVTLLNVYAVVETRDGRIGRGRGSMTMGNAWGWPSKVVPSDKTLEAMVQLGKDIVQYANDCTEVSHPLELCTAIGLKYDELANVVTSRMNLAEPMPRLAQLVAASPFEAALFDAYGKALNQNSYKLLGKEYVNSDLAQYLNDDFKGEYLDQYVLPEIRPRMPLYHLVGALDPLTDADVAARLNDGLPETLGEWVKYNGLTHLKVKLNGDDLDWDVMRMAEIESVVALAKAEMAKSGAVAADWIYSADFNEKCQSADYVLEWLRKVDQKSPNALRRLQYIEQPTNRDLKKHPENKMFEPAKIKPVVIDESLINFESLLLSRQMGYSGVALKACKGQAEALLMAAAAQKYKMFLSVQDLTCPGLSFLHSATISAWIPGVAAIEGNGRQYCPSANLPWEEKYPSLFKIDDGSVGTAALNGPGLGF